LGFDQESLFTCPLCQKSFLAVLDLEKHVNFAHGDILSPDEKKTAKTTYQNQINGKIMYSFHLSYFLNLNIHFSRWKWKPLLSSLL